MLINELSRRTGIPIATLRYYEGYGLITGRPDSSIRSNNYKHYDEETVALVEWIIEAKQAGFTLGEIKQWLNDWFNKRLSVSRKLEIVHKKIAEVDEKISQLRRLKKLLQRGIRDIENDVC
ncbi:MAG: MerR family transcriptional regulator [Sphingobacteriales bacterium]|nr:MAG: MerR family transcriptional regulator [Sphingobacteriales bacterium]